MQYEEQNHQSWNSHEYSNFWYIYFQIILMNIQIHVVE